VDALGISLPGLIVQLVNFVLLLVVLRIFLYKPILKMLDQRRQRIAESVQAADTMKAQAAAADAQVQEQLAQARAEGQALIAAAQQNAARVQEEAQTAARAEAEALIARARGEIELERDNAIASLRAEFADLTVAAAEKVINQSLDKSAHQRLIDEVLSQSSFRGN
jgi:F-type H+-transporting ATPase subunit b